MMMMMMMMMMMRRHTPLYESRFGRRIGERVYLCRLIVSPSLSDAPRVSRHDEALQGYDHHSDRLPLVEGHFLCDSRRERQKKNT
jgi:hypothetical protein